MVKVLEGVAVEGCFVIEITLETRTGHVLSFQDISLGSGEEATTQGNYASAPFD